MSTFEKFRGLFTRPDTEATLPGMTVEQARAAVEAVTRVRVQIAEHDHDNTDMCGSCADLDLNATSEAARYWDAKAVLAVEDPAALAAAEALADAAIERGDTAREATITGLAQEMTGVRAREVLNRQHNAERNAMNELDYHMYPDSRQLEAARRITIAEDPATAAAADTAYQQSKAEQERQAQEWSRARVEQLSASMSIEEARGVLDEHEEACQLANREDDPRFPHPEEYDAARKVVGRHPSIGIDSSIEDEDAAQNDAHVPYSPQWWEAWSAMGAHARRADARQWDVELADQAEQELTRQHGPEVLADTGPESAAIVDDARDRIAGELDDEHHHDLRAAAGRGTTQADMSASVSTAHDVSATLSESPVSHAVEQSDPQQVDAPPADVPAPVTSPGAGTDVSMGFGFVAPRPSNRLQASSTLSGVEQARTAMSNLRAEQTNAARIESEQARTDQVNLWAARPAEDARDFGQGFGRD